MISVTNAVAGFGSLPTINGTYRKDYPLSKITWFKVGGAAEWLCVPSDLSDLKCLLSGIPAQENLRVMGVGSNLLVRDGGVRGIVVRLGRGFSFVEVDGSDLLVGAGALDIVVSRRAAAAGIAGLEFLIGIPGTIGGAICMNAGAYGKEIAEVIVYVEAIDREGVLHQLHPADFNFEYRRALVPSGLTLTAAKLRGVAGDKQVITSAVAELQSKRALTQPIRKRTGGSTFKNPKKNKVRAWELVEAAGCRGLTRGGAIVSAMHCNFLVNTGNATAADIEDLGEDVRQRVQKRTGVDLEWEIERIGSRYGVNP